MSGFAIFFMIFYRCDLSIYRLVSKFDFELDLSRSVSSNRNESTLLLLAMDQVERFLESNDLKAYKVYFEEEGYDSMPQLLSMSSDEFMSVCDATKIKKTGHMKRFIAAIAVLE